MKRKIVSVIGARPQFIKCAPLSRELRKRYKEILLHTGQHYDRNMSRLFFDELNIPAPDYNLGIGSGSHAEQTSRMLLGIEKILMKEKPDLVLIYGDTNSTVAGALAAVKLFIPAAHVEAGLRSFNKEMPEEHNRIVSDHLCSILFAPSCTAMVNLRKEGLSRQAFQVGDIMYDALLGHMRIAKKKSRILEQLKLTSEGYYLATVHRPSNTDNKDNLRRLLKAFSLLDKKVVFPVHPRTKKRMRDFNIHHDHKKILMIEPVGYLDMIKLIQSSRKVLTDSGGVQKEAFYLGKEVIVLREESEWTELVERGVSRLAGTDVEKIKQLAFHRTRSRRDFYPYGHGDTRKRIVHILDKYLK